MAIVPVRQLGSAGVVTDVDPFNLPFNVFTRAKNVSFDGGNIKRSPVFRTVEDVGAAFTSPKFAMGVFSETSYDSILIATDNLSIYEYASGTGTFTSVHSGSASSSTEAYTGTVLSNVQYINRPDNVPLHRDPSASVFTSLTNWTSTWRTQSLRSYRDFLVALNVTEGSTSYPTRVRFSDISLANSVPSSWDATDATKSAGFNDLVQMETPIVDGATLGSNFIIYSSDQVWLMEFVGGTFIMNFRKLFNDAGVINQNCIVEVQGRHYVFDRDDIYVTDAVSRQSICDGRVRDYIFNGMDSASTSRCFVFHNEMAEEVYFCYKSQDDMAEFTSGSACNRAAVYNYKSDTWSFMDLPNVISATTANLNTVSTYAASILTYDNAGGTYHQQAAAFSRHPIFVSIENTADGLTDDTLYALDSIDTSQVSKPISSAANKGIFLERIGLDMDTEVSLPIDTYKVVKRLSPQVSTLSADKTFEFTVGASDVANVAPTYGSAVTFTAGTDYKVDLRQAGRYLAYKIGTGSTVKDFVISGFDLDIVAVGRR